MSKKPSKQKHTPKPEHQPCQPGDDVSVICKDNKEYKGVLMPNENTANLVLKLNNGYNIGIERSKIKTIKLLKKHHESKTYSDEKIHPNNNKPTITILHTGGTIASKVDYETGGVIAKFSANDLVEMIPEIKSIANIKTELISNMMSEDMTFSDYKKIAEVIKKHVESGVKGIIIGHGTDTLTFTAAALGFMFEKINIPVLIVGAQRSTDRGSTDAAMNLTCAAEFIAKSDFIGIAICMHHSTNDYQCAVLPATKTRKMHTSRRDAFKAVNDSPIALINYNTREINYIKKEYAKKTKDNKVILKDKFDTNVGLLKVHPNISNSLFEFFAKDYKAFVLEATGLGHAPTNFGKENLKNYETLKKFINKKGIVAVTSQCLFGRVHPNVYTNLRRLSSIGCVFCEDMLPETAFIKLAWLLGNYKREEAKKLMSVNLRGEITERTGTDFLED